MTLFEEVCYKYELATGNKLDPKVIRIGDEASWTSHKALESLQYEPTGNLAILLMTKAWEDYKEDRSIVIKSIFEKDFETRLTYMREFEELITKGEPAKLLQETINLIKKVSKVFELNDKIDNLLNNKTKFIDVFEEAYTNIYDKYHVDRFGCVDNKDYTEPFIGKHEYHFHTLQDFVNCLRRSDNCIVYAKIDSLYDYDDPTDYDIFYAFGCRCGDKVYINSDRDDHATPVSRAIKLTRNPQKKLRNKANGTYMPYYDIRENRGKHDQQDNETALTIIDPTITPPKAINELYDDLAQLMIICSMVAIYQKYFINRTVDYRYPNYGKEQGKKPVEDSYFGNEIKLLPSVTTALALPNELQLPAIQMNQIEVTHKGLWTNDITFYDWYVKEYIKEDDLLEPIPITEFIGNKRQAELRAWWTYRNEAKTLINERRTKDVCSQFYDPNVYYESKELVPFEVELEPSHTSFGEVIEHNWGSIHQHNTHWIKGINRYGLQPFLLRDFNVADKINNNLKNILIDILTSGERQVKSKWSFGVGYRYFMNNEDITRKEINKITGVSIHPSIYENIDNPNFRVDTLTRILESESESKDSWRRYSKYWKNNKDNTIIYNQELGMYLNYDRLDTTIHIYPERDSINKNYCFIYECETFYDLCYLFNCKREELPRCLRRWLGEGHSFKPSTGNHILSITDPLDKVFDIIDSNFNLQLKFYFGKSDINYYLKLLNMKPDELQVRDRSKDRSDD